MLHDLDELYEGLEWCRRKTSDLEREADAFSGINVTLREHLATGAPPVGGPKYGHAMALLAAPIPTDFVRETGAIMGEIRIKLDHLANVLERRAGVNDASASFPLTSDPARWNAEAKRKIKGLSPADKQKIEDLQPFRTGIQILLKLSSIDNFRKHKAPLGFSAVAVARVDRPGTQGHCGVGPSEPLTQAGQEVHVAEFMGSDAEVDIAAVRLIFVGPQELEGALVIPFLTEAADAVQDVIRAFETA